MAQEFALRLGAAANARAEQAAARESYRVSPEDVLAALEVVNPWSTGATLRAHWRWRLQALGLGAYAAEVERQQAEQEQQAQVRTAIPATEARRTSIHMDATERQEKKRRAASRRARSGANGASRDELLAEQTALFQQASRQAAREGW